MVVVTDRLPLFTGIELLAPARLRLVPAEPPPLSRADQAAVDDAWDEAVRVKPGLFDGPVAASGGLRWDEAQPGTLVLTWLRATYRRYVSPRTPGSARWLPHLFVSVLQPTDDGALMVGRMATWTSSPGRWQLPSGTGEPPETVGDPLEVADLRALAARELLEETGTELPAADLRFWRLSRGSQGDVGVLFLAPPRPAGALRASYAALVDAERAVGHEPELDQIAFVRVEADLPALGDPRGDVDPILRAFRQDAPDLAAVGDPAAFPLGRGR
ncbi:NUDIX domain-containing protein [Frankia sp. AgB1.9]|uniref:NUDIX domain-containing protein n=1 Tax=Frankia sp. AgB1.9 TaxID=1836968 RepID=UPI00193204B1|nr:NUDIX domain-containing protein [Frankia sp. AgB1.9]MBL7548792.1 NUDIX domain-containing protein [Frankia sp. AgB1.9]